MKLTIPVYVALLAVCADASDRSSPASMPLRLQDVLDSVERQYPPLLAALGDIEVADAEVLAAEGRFDAVLRTRFDSDSFGYYSNRRGDIWLEQPLAAQGMSLYGGYRVGAGEFAPYDGKLDTRSLGEVRSGIKLPLLRDRSIDSRRGELSKARIGRRLASLGVDQQKLLIVQSATHRYWSWVAAGIRLTISREVLGIAQTRQNLLDDAVKEGHLPQIEARDNQRAILQRKSQLIEAERALQQAAIDLSLFYRGPNMQPIVPSLDQVPLEFPVARPVDEQRIRDDRQAALQRRPEVERFSAQRDQLEVDRRLAANAAKPAVDLNAGFVSDRGTSAVVRRGPEEFKAGISFEFPLRNRSARGKEAAADAKIRQLDLRARFLADQIEAEVQDAASAVNAAAQRVAILTDELEVSRQLEQAERARFELGEGTLFVLNLREQNTADAAVRKALAEADYQRARASYDYAIGALR